MSLRYVLMDLTLFSPGDNQDEARKDLTWLLEGLTQRDQAYLKDHPRTPLLYKSGVRYERPAQFNGDCEEVMILRRALGSKVRGEVADTLDTVQQVLGGERFRDIGRILENGSGDCFPLSQKIIVRSRSTSVYELLSLSELRHVYPAYEALSYSFSKCQYEFKSIVGFVDKGIKAVSKARLSNGTDLIATDDHKFWTLNGQRQSAPYPDSFELGYQTMGGYVETYADFKAGKLSKGQRQRRSRIIQAAQIPALNTVRYSAAEAYLAGIYAAEGCRSGSHTTIGQHKAEVREKIENVLNEIGMSYRYAPGRGATPGSGAEYRLHGGSAHPVIAALRAQGMNSFDKHIPQSMLSADADTVARVLEGHGDGDAWRPKDAVDYAFPRPSLGAVYATSSIQLMEQIRLGLLLLGRPGEIVPGLTFGTVRNARPFGKAHVGCIEVEDNHNFFLADGTLVSNCDNVSCWRAAELRQAGIKASPYITWRRRLDGGTTYHVLVRWPDNTLEDPSLLLGMGGPARKADREEELRKNKERCEMALRAAGKNTVLGSTHYRGGYKLQPDPLDQIDLNTLLGFTTVTPGVYGPPIDLDKMFRDEVVGQGNPGLGPWTHGNAILPGDPQHGTRFDPNIHDPALVSDFIDLDRTFDESFDDAMVRRTGRMRGA